MRTRGNMHEHCERCAVHTPTLLHPRWARQIAGILATNLLLLPVAAVFLASDPVLTIVSFLGLGCAAGPAAMVLRSKGVCAECALDRTGFAVRRLGVRHFFSAAAG